MSRLVYPAVEVKEKHFLGQGGALAQAEQLEDAVFLAGQMQRTVVDFDNPGVEIDDELAGADDRLRVTLGAPDYGMDARHQLAAIERLSQEVIGAEAQALELVIKLG